MLTSNLVLGAAKRTGAGLSLRPHFMARRPLLQRGPLCVEQAADEAQRCAPAPLTDPCARATTPATPCTDPTPPAVLTRRLTPSRPSAAQPLSGALLAFAQALARGRMASSRLNGGAARRRSGGSLARLGRLGGPAAPEAALARAPLSCIFVPPQKCRTRVGRKDGANHAKTSPLL